MKTYKEVVEKPRLVIKYDTDAESPRHEDNIGFFFTNEKRYNSPDGIDHVLYNIMMETQFCAGDTETHIKRIKKEAQEAGIHITDIYPVYRHEHGNVLYLRGKAKGFDDSNCGFYIVTTETIEGETYTQESIEKAIDAELKTYTQWMNGDVYGFILHDEDGEHQDSCWGFYSLEDIREHLPEEWKDEDLSDYLTHE